MRSDQDNDPRELKNVAENPKNKEARAALSQLLKNYTADFPPGK